MKNLHMPQWLQQIPEFIRHNRLIFTWLIILALFGYTLLQAQAISDPVADEDYLFDQRREIDTATLNVDEDLKNQIESLLETPVDTTPDNLGTRDPFNP